jgi:hypothetical protein
MPAPSTARLPLATLSYGPIRGSKSRPLRTTPTTARRPPRAPPHLLRQLGLPRSTSAAASAATPGRRSQGQPHLQRGEQEDGGSVHVGAEVVAIGAPRVVRLAASAAIEGGPGSRTLGRPGGAVPRALALLCRRAGDAAPPARQEGEHAARQRVSKRRSTGRSPRSQSKRPRTIASGTARTHTGTLNPRRMCTTSGIRLVHSPPSQMLGQ